MIARADEKILISEIFGPTIQGEGGLIGAPTVFVRTGGCDYRCSWCDSLFAVESEYRHSWTPMSVAQVWQKVEQLSHHKPLMITLSGGNPAIQPFAPLIRLGHAQHYRFALETQGSIAQSWFKDLDMLILSPKPPSSQMETDWDKLDECRARADGGPKQVLKIVVFDDEDYEYAKRVARRYPALKLFLQPGNPSPSLDPQGLAERLKWLVAKTLDDQWFAPRILPQLHVMLWGDKRGV